MTHAELRTEIDQRLAALMPPPSEGDLLCRAMREAVTAPGKRIRPLLVMLAAREIDADRGAAREIGCALEMIHAASLLLDDLPCMDDATLRRGQAAAHVRYGEDVAILASIGLLSRAFGVLADAPVPSEIRARLVVILAEAVGECGLVGGQYGDLHGAGTGSASAVARVNHMKTGVLFVAGMEMIALAGDASAADRARLVRFADELGQAFQLFDDLLDRTAKPSEIGKDVGKDADKTTLIALLGEAGARERLSVHLAAMREAATPASASGGSLIGLIDTIFPLLPATEA